MQREKGGRWEKERRNGEREGGEGKGRGEARMWVITFESKKKMVKK